MKKTILCILIALVAIWGAFYTENLSERQHREELAQMKPDQLVSAMMKDSLQTLTARAVTLRQLKEGLSDEQFVRQHGRVLGIGSPTFYVVCDQCHHATATDEEIHATAEGFLLTIPLKYIFGNTAREASGWFHIDHFQNTTDFNAVSAAMNAYIARQLKSYKPHDSGEVEFLAGVAIHKGKDNEHLTLIPYQLK